MPAELNPIDKAKFVAAKRATEYVEDGMKLGLGTGSTSASAVAMSSRVRRGPLPAGIHASASGR